MLTSKKDYQAQHKVLWFAVLRKGTAFEQYNDIYCYYY